MKSFSAFFVAAVLGLWLSTADASAVLFNWEDWRNATAPNTNFTINDPLNGTETKVNPGSADHGLSTGGGVTGFKSQSTIFNTPQGDLGVTLYYSQNLEDKKPIIKEGPDFYYPVENANPDAEVTGNTGLRFTNDRKGNGTITPATIVMSFSKQVNISEFIVGSLSQVGINTTII